jgi:NAD(P)-dependent dehydrogenase (short-subunit alcohol dehydrogenase family)
VKLRDQVAIITGAGAGIGRESAILFAQEGAKVVVADIADEAGRETCRLIGGDAVFLKADVASWGDTRDMVSETMRRFGRLDILFNNAGIFVSSASDIIGTSERDWDRAIDVNLKSVFMATHHALGAMIPQRHGVIINTASQAGLVGRPRMAAYCAAKAGIISLTRQLAVDYGPYNIRVNCICPGAMEKPMGGPNALSTETPEQFVQRKKRVVENVPLGRFCKAQEAASAALYLACGESAYVTGSALVVDGGFGAL